jgi:hypothetical protein
MNKNINCKNCNTKFSGNFCNNCGEKVINDGDFALMKLLSQVLDTFTHLDSKVFKTLKLLLFYPGKLSKLYTEGIRVPYMKPFQIYIIINIIFFFIFSNDDIFRVPSHYFFQENYDGIKTLAKVRNIIKETGVSETHVAELYDSRSTNLAKGLLVLLIPIIALLGKLFHSKQNIQFGKHIIFSTHLITFILSLFVISSLFLGTASSNLVKKTALVVMGFCTLTYYTIALKNFYNNSLLMACIKGILFTFLTIITFSIYKILISVLALYSL